MIKAMSFYNGVSVTSSINHLIGDLIPVMQGNGFFPITRLSGSLFMPMVIIGGCFVFFLPNSQELILTPTANRRFNILTPVPAANGEVSWVVDLKAGLFVAVILAWSLVSLSAGSEFLYYQF